MLRIFLATVVLLSSTSIFAARQYVSDVLYIPVRTGPSNEHKIIAYLKSGTKVSSLASQGEYSQIKSHGEKKHQGWVKERFLSSEPIAAQKLETLKQDLERIDSLKADLQKFKSESQDSAKQNKKLNAQLERIKRVSSSAVAIDEENQGLKVEVERLQKELTEVKERNFVLENDQRNEGIKLGIFAIALGAIVGFILPYLKPRNQRRKNNGIRLR